MKIFIWGSGGQGRVVLDILRESRNFDIVGFVDSNKNLKGKIIDGLEILGSKECLDNLLNQGVEGAIVAVGDNEIRCQRANFLKEKGFQLVNAIHPRAGLASNVSIGNNVTIASGAIICAHALVENDAIINTGAIVEHENIIRKGVHIAPGVRLAGRVEIGEKTLIGIGATVIQGLKVGAGSIIGAGAVVIRDIPDNVVAVGIPAKVIKKM